MKTIIKNYLHEETKLITLQKKQFKVYNRAAQKSLKLWSKMSLKDREDVRHLIEKME